ncbi:MAG: four helix bundle protein [Bacteroidota bacterium]|nr:four helix bundle protein [Bacteroidota bacterium]
MITSHKNLTVWQEAMKPVAAVYEITKHFPDEEKFGLISQMRRSAVSIPSNIAEGAARQTTKDSLDFYIIARASLSELDTQLELCNLLKYLSTEVSSR